MFFKLQVSMVYPIFFLWLILNFIALWSENMHGLISIFLYLLRADLWPSMWSILENVPHALEKNVYSAALGWNVLNISVCPSGPGVIYSHCFLLISCLDNLSIVVCGVLNYLTIMVLLSISLLIFVINWFIYLGALKLRA